MELPINYSTSSWQERREAREEYARRQKGMCFYCRSQLDKEPPSAITKKPVNWKLFPPQFLKYPVHLQHNHDTDMTEGAVHAYCNAVMWQYEGR
ncbi:hypothetical protein G7068_16025 [Leucobacter viscericola]|uniref:HNH endonuclease n=1 Tax=Leucobacter viscericola TaxID=2714935 RepID=A0A6G7XIW2_9MICO|nr:hypothetical protein [Leucobacter viscericola]QIK64554.1 hypothetical protein G7068_16025 [Leucobacter viscericola]